MDNHLLEIKIKYDPSKARNPLLLSELLQKQFKRIENILKTAWLEGQKDNFLSGGLTITIDANDIKDTK